MTTQKSGLIIILAALLAIGTMVTILGTDINRRQAETTQTDGAALARLLAGFSYHELAPTDGSISVLEVLRTRIARSSLAYAAVYDNAGLLSSHVGEVPDTAPAAAGQPRQTSALSERRFSTSGGQEMMEFAAPLLNGGQIVGAVRVGFVTPGLGAVLSDLPLLARLALPVSLLIPLFYFLMRQQIQPLRAIGKRLDEMAARMSEPSELEPSEDLRSFIGNFERFMQLAEARQNQIQTKQSDALMQQRLLTYEKSRVESALQSIPDGVMLVNESGLISFINDNLSLMLRLTRDMVIDKPVAEWCEDAAMTSFLRRLQNVNSLCRVETAEIPPCVHCDKTLLLTAVPLFSPKDSTTVFGSVVLFRDISAEAHARAARDEFVAHVAHEIKNPLNVINMQAETLAEFGAESQEMRVTAINVIQDEVDRLSRMISDLLNITQIEGGNLSIQRTPVKLRELLEDAFVATMRAGEARNIVPKLALPRQLPSILADKDLLRLALNNLLTNAIKYNRDAGTVTLEAIEQDDFVLIRISDEGVGIAKEEQARIFDKFYRADDPDARSREGHGLGLALARQVIEMHFGSIDVESEPGVGTTFTITLEKDVNQLQEAV